jgi:hypothetical protein
LGKGLVDVVEVEATTGALPTVVTVVGVATVVTVDVLNPARVKVNIDTQRQSHSQLLRYLLTLYTRISFIAHLFMKQVDLLALNILSIA